MPTGIEWGAVEAAGTIAAACLAVFIWRADIARQRRMEAARVTARIERGETRVTSMRISIPYTSVVVSNGSGTPMFDVVVTRTDCDAQPLMFGLIRSGQSESANAAEAMLLPGQIDNVDLSVEFTMHGLRWTVGRDGKPRRRRRRALSRRQRAGATARGTTSDTPAQSGDDEPKSGS
jgi:hypothetical protein